MVDLRAVAQRYFGPQLGWTAILVPSFYLGECLLIAATAGFVGYLKYVGLLYWQIWMVMWGVNVLLSASVLLLCDFTRIDITLMRALRIAVNDASSRSVFFGRVLEVLIFFRLLIWDGASHFLLFFGGRFLSKTSKLAILIAASGFQMWVWSVLYSMGYDSLFDLMGHYQKG